MGSGANCPRLDAVRSVWNIRQSVLYFIRFDSKGMDSKAICIRMYTVRRRVWSRRQSAFDFIRFDSKGIGSGANCIRLHTARFSDLPLATSKKKDSLSCLPAQKDSRLPGDCTTHRRTASTGDCEVAVEGPLEELRATTDSAVRDGAPHCGGHRRSPAWRLRWVRRPPCGKPTLIALQTSWPFF